ncbi:MAG: phosphotransferase [Candidatus Poribacteria bacterium]|nr:phosphotransferase [Candidatus Poribacteria bacterium]
MAKALDKGTLRAIAERALDGWELRVAQLEFISISENTTFRVDTEAGETYALRIHRPGYHNLAELNSEQQWTAALNRAGIGVPVPLMTRDGHGYATVPVPGSTEIRHIGIVEWIDGVLLGRIVRGESDEGALTQCYDQLGRIAARIHNQAVSWQIPADFQRHEFDADGLMGDAPFWGPFWVLPEMTHAERKLIRNARHAIHRVLSDYGKGQGTYSLIHADLHPHNLLVNGNQLYAIDFDDAGFGWHQYELAVALFDSQGNPLFDIVHDALIAGYRSERPLSDAAIELLPMFLLIRSLALLGWIHERPEHNKGERLRRLIRLACAQAEELQT